MIATLETEMATSRQSLYSLQDPPQRAKELCVVIERDKKRIAATKESYSALRLTFHKQEAELADHQQALHQLLQLHPHAKDDLATPLIEPASVDRRELKKLLDGADMMDASALREYLRLWAQRRGHGILFSRLAASVTHTCQAARIAQFRQGNATPPVDWGGFVQFSQAQSDEELRQRMAAHLGQHTENNTLREPEPQPSSRRFPFGQRASWLSPYKSEEQRAHSADPATREDTIRSPRHRQCG